jgi:hypothetical protein
MGKKLNKQTRKQSGCALGPVPEKPLESGKEHLRNEHHHLNHQKAILKYYQASIFCRIDMQRRIHIKGCACLRSCGLINCIQLLYIESFSTAFLFCLISPQRYCLLINCCCKSFERLHFACTNRNRLQSAVNITYQQDWS